MFKETSKDVLAFIKNSPSCFHAVHEMKKILLDAGYEELRECETWSLKKVENTLRQEMVLLLLLSYW